MHQTIHTNCFNIYTTLVSDKITTHSYAGFSRYAKQYFIQLYKYECVISNCYIFSNAT